MYRYGTEKKDIRYCWTISSDAMQHLYVDILVLNHRKEHIYCIGAVLYTVYMNSVILGTRGVFATQTLLSKQKFFTVLIGLSTFVAQARVQM